MANTRPARKRQGSSRSPAAVHAATANAEARAYPCPAAGRRGGAGGAGRIMQAGWQGNAAAPAWRIANNTRHQDRPAAAPYQAQCSRRMPPEWAHSRRCPAHGVPPFGMGGGPRPAHKCNPRAGTMLASWRSSETLRCPRSRVPSCGGTTSSSNCGGSSRRGSASAHSGANRFLLQRQRQPVLQQRQAAPPSHIHCLLHIIGPQRGGVVLASRGDVDALSRHHGGQGRVLGALLDLRAP